MGNFLENVIDWGLSHERYWGTPLPVWTCECGHIHVVGSNQELREMATKEIGEIELHRPYIDEFYSKDFLQTKEACEENPLAKEIVSLPVIQPAATTPTAMPSGRLWSATASTIMVDLPRLQALPSGH